MGFQNSKLASYNGTAPIDVSSGDQVRHRLSRARNRRINHALHMMDDPPANAVYLYLTDEPLTPGRTTIQATNPPTVPGFIALDWKDGRLVGIEILDASARLHHDLVQEPKSSAEAATS